MKPLKILYLFLVCYSFGSMKNILVLGDDETRTKEISNSYYKPGTGHGSVVSNVNLFTGQPSYSIPLYNISVRGEVGFPIGLSYSGPVKPIVERTNDVSPSGLIGVGWSINFPFVALSHKGTFTSTDDVIICNLGQFGGGQLLYHSDSSKYFISNNPTIKISTTLQDSGDLIDQIEEWVFTMPNGVKLIFGQSDDTVSNTERILRYNNSLVTGNPLALTGSKPFIYKWDLRRMEDPSGKNILEFEYQKDTESLANGYHYDRESHLANIFWKDTYGNEVENVEFTYQSLSTGEHYTFPDSSAKSDQRLFEKKRLSDIKVYRETDLLVHYELINSEDTTSYGIKRKLDSINIYHGAAKTYKSDGWAYTYNSGFNLTDITKPNKSTDHFTYTNFSWDNLSSWGQDTTTHLLRKKNGDSVTAWSNPYSTLSSQCNGRHCYALASNANPANLWFYLNVYSIYGNYYDSVYVEENQWKDVYVAPRDDYFLIVRPNYNDDDSGGIGVREWNGETFINIDSLFDRPIDTAITNPIEVHAEDNYFVVQETGDNRRTWVYLKKPNGDWIHLTAGFNSDTTLDSCGIDQLDFGQTVWPSNKSHCLEWNQSVTVRTSPSMFIISPDNGAILYAFTLKKDGSGFNAVDHMAWDPDDDCSLCHSTYKNRMSSSDQKVAELHLSSDYFLFKIQDNSHQTQTKYLIFSYTGSEMKYVQELDWESDDRNVNAPSQIWDRNAWVSSDYFIVTNLESDYNQPRSIKFYKKQQVDDSIYFTESELDSHLTLPGGWLNDADYMD